MSKRIPNITGCAVAGCGACSSDTVIKRAVDPAFRADPEVAIGTAANSLGNKTHCVLNDAAVKATSECSGVPEVAVDAPARRNGEGTVGVGNGTTSEFAGLSVPEEVVAAQAGKRIEGTGCSKGPGHTSTVRKLQAFGGSPIPYESKLTVTCVNSIV